jgi:hypothetical protein
VAAAALMVGAAACGDSDDEGSGAAAPKTTVAPPGEAADAPAKDRPDAADAAGGEGEGAASRSAGSDTAAEQSAADAVTAMFRGIARGDAKALCEAQAGAGGDGRSDDGGGLSKIVAASGALDGIRDAKVVDVAIVGRRAKVTTRFAGKKHRVWLTRTGPGSWRVIPEALGQNGVPLDDALGGAAPAR